MKQPSSKQVQGSAKCVVLESNRLFMHDYAVESLLPSHLYTDSQEKKPVRKQKLPSVDVNC